MRKPIRAMALGMAGLSLGLAAGVSAPALAQDAASIYGEREYAMAVDSVCDLFTRPQRDALDAARLQARGILLRDGVSEHVLDDYSSDIAAEASRTACHAPEIAAMQARVSGAFTAYQRMIAMDFPGDTFSWSASRSAMPGAANWALLQDTGEIRVGISQRDGKRRLTASLPHARGATSAVLVLRDVDAAPELYDPTMGGSFPGPADAPWAEWTPPSYARSLYWASGRGDAATVAELAASDTSDVFYFSDEAMRALGARDPREAARIELIDRRGRTVAVHHFEVGDFAAGLAFLRAGDTAADSTGDPRS